MRILRSGKVLRRPLDRLLTDRAARVLDLARESAAAYRHENVTPETLLLGLIRQGRGVALQTLSTLGISPHTIGSRVEAGLEPGRSGAPDASRAENVLTLARREAYELGHGYIGTEHILLGLVRAGEGPAARIITGMGADLLTLRRQTVRVLRGPRPADWD